MKRKRHALILEIIEKYNITTQDELLEKLSENGFDVTQATISRDIKELRLVKTMNASGQYCYSLNKSTTTDHSAKFHAIFKESVISINYAGNICSIKCYSGMAPAACAGIDAMHWDGVVGTLAGDDTIFVLCTDNEKAAALKKSINKLING